MPDLKTIIDDIHDDLTEAMLPLSVVISKLHSVVPSGVVGAAEDDLELIIKRIQEIRNNLNKRFEKFNNENK